MLATDVDPPVDRPDRRGGRRRRRSEVEGPLDLRPDVLAASRRGPRALGGPTLWWHVGRLLLAGAFIALPFALFWSFRPVVNPGVQDCGAPAAFFFTGREDVIVLPPLAGEVVSPDERAQSVQPTCRERAADEMRRAGRAGAFFLVAALLGAVCGLIDDRIAYRRSPRFESLLRDLPRADRERHGLVAQVRVDDLGVHLPPVERPEVIGLVFWGLLALVGLPLVGAWSLTLDVFTDLSVPALVLAVCAVVLRFVAAGAQRHPVAPSLAHWRQTALVTVASAWTGRLRPLLGTFGTDVHGLRRGGVTRGDAVRRVRALETSSLVVHLVLLVPAGLAALIYDRPPFAPALHTLVLVFVVLLLMANGLAHAPRRWRALPVRPMRAALALERVAPTGQGRAVLVAGTIGLPVAETVVLYAVLAAVGAPLPAAVVLFVALAAVTAGALGPVSGGAPMTQAAAMLLLVVIGVEPSRAAAAAVIYGLLVHWLPLVPGVFAGRRLRQAGQL